MVTITADFSKTIGEVYSISSVHPQVTRLRRGVGLFFKSTLEGFGAVLNLNLFNFSKQLSEVVFFP